jgi:DNA-binding transcriptional MerR regulator
VPDLAPLQQAAAEFGLNPATLHRYIKKGKLQRWRREMDQRTYVDRDELRRLLEFRPVDGDDGR